MGNTILVIDDMKFNRVILSRLLEDEYDIQEAADTVRRDWTIARSIPMRSAVFCWI